MLNDSIIAKIEVTYYASGALSTSGNIGDKQFAISLLENAIDAIRNRQPSSLELVTPNYDVGVPTSRFPLVEEKPR
jgi:hypothetical protein